VQHDSYNRQHEAKLRLLQSQRNLNQGQDNDHHHNSTDLDITVRRETNMSDISHHTGDGGMNTPNAKNNKHHRDSRDSGHRETHRDSQVRQPAHRHASTSDIIQINALGKTPSSGTTPFNVASIPSPHGPKWGGASAGSSAMLTKSIMEGHGQHSSGDEHQNDGTASTGPPPPARKGGPNVKREMVKFA
jgi:hypothetical protein